MCTYIRITINKIYIVGWNHCSDLRTVYFDINIDTNINMAIVNTSLQICLMKYQYKENHPYTDMTNEDWPKDKTIYVHILWLPLQEVIEGAKAWSKSTRMT